ncbi:hypothetical protein M406DRAFT_73909 [Cryphonectria parasitica EP155]|uniref:Uncharacterized protein n=1 Tax=Cryphonectria parasitica (strain ATCC 38755 / EP155) TaxID=660469 RepID=A0A9P4XYK4_CRYP1|nr:uncharacterized protein M406DRAFT_73909 [Cryphonectria parasitica EP155]KAF3763291.1 hypothetical protein M406DRAFT_73909 [Cryphonectria parasitica EP155]
MNMLEQGSSSNILAGSLADLVKEKRRGFTTQAITDNYIETPRGRVLPLTLLPVHPGSLSLLTYLDNPVEIQFSKAGVHIVVENYASIETIPIMKQAAKIHNSVYLLILGCKRCPGQGISGNQSFFPLGRVTIPG